MSDSDPNSWRQFHSYPRPNQPNTSGAIFAQLNQGQYQPSEYHRSLASQTQQIPSSNAAVIEDGTLPSPEMLCAPQPPFDQIRAGSQHGYGQIQMPTATGTGAGIHPYWSAKPTRSDSHIHQQWPSAMTVNAGATAMPTAVSSTPPSIHPDPAETRHQSGYLTDQSRQSTSSSHYRDGRYVETTPAQDYVQYQHPHSTVVPPQHDITTRQFTMEELRQRQLAQQRQQIEAQLRAEELQKITVANEQAERERRVQAEMARIEEQRQLEQKRQAELVRLHQERAAQAARLKHQEEQMAEAARLEELRQQELKRQAELQRLQQERLEQAAQAKQEQQRAQAQAAWTEEQRQLEQKRQAEMFRIQQERAAREAQEAEAARIKQEQQKAEAARIEEERQLEERKQHEMMRLLRERIHQERLAREAHLKEEQQKALTAQYERERQEHIARLNQQRQAETAVPLQNNQPDPFRLQQQPLQYEAVRFEQQRLGDEARKKDTEVNQFFQQRGTLEPLEQGVHSEAARVEQERLMEEARKQREQQAEAFRLEQERQAQAARMEEQRRIEASTQSRSDAPASSDRPAGFPKHGLIAAAALQLLTSTNPGLSHTLTEPRLVDFLNSQPTYYALCDWLESFGFVVDKAQLAMRIYQAVPDIVSHPPPARRATSESGESEASTPNLSGPTSIPASAPPSRTLPVSALVNTAPTSAPGAPDEASATLVPASPPDQFIVPLPRPQSGHGGAPTETSLEVVPSTLESFVPPSQPVNSSSDEPLNLGPTSAIQLSSQTESRSPILPVSQPETEATVEPKKARISKEEAARKNSFADLLQLSDSSNLGMGLDDDDVQISLDDFRPAPMSLPTSSFNQNSSLSAQVSFPPPPQQLPQQKLSQETLQQPYQPHHQLLQQPHQQTHPTSFPSHNPAVPSVGFSHPGPIMGPHPVPPSNAIPSMSAQAFIQPGGGAGIPHHFAQPQPSMPVQPPAPAVVNAESSKRKGRPRRRLVLPLNTKKMAKPTVFNLDTLAYDVLAAIGGFSEVIPPLNYQYLPLHDAFPDKLRLNSDLSTIDWDLLQNLYEKERKNAMGKRPANTGRTNDGQFGKFPAEGEPDADDEADAGDISQLEPNSVVGGGAVDANGLPVHTPVKIRGKRGSGRPPGSKNRNRKSDASVTGVADLNDKPSAWQTSGAGASDPASSGNPNRGGFFSASSSSFAHPSRIGGYGGGILGSGAGSQTGLSRTIGGNGRPPPFPVFKCRWQQCQAELHNLRTLRKHIRTVHCGNASEGGKFYCRWNGCQSKPNGAIAFNPLPRPDSSSNGGSRGQDAAAPSLQSFLNIDAWCKHMDAHVDAIGAQQGDGPVCGFSETEVSEAYLSDTQGRMVTPRVSAVPKWTATNDGYRFDPKPLHTRALQVQRSVRAWKRAVGPSMDRTGARLVDAGLRNGFLDDLDFEQVIDSNVDEVDMFPFYEVWGSETHDPGRMQSDKALLERDNMMVEDGGEQEDAIMVG